MRANIRFIRYVLCFLIVVFCASSLHALEEYRTVTVKGEKWVPSSTIKVYQGDELYKYIDGGAEVYLKAGMVKATVVSCQAKNHREPVMVEIYQMAGSDGAQKVYTKHLSKGAVGLSLGDESHYVKQVLTVRKEAFYLRIYTYEKLSNEREILLAIAREMLGKLELQK